MPEILDRCVQDVMAKGHDEKSAWAICRTSMDMAEGKSEEDVLKMARQLCDEIKAGTRQFALPDTFEINDVPIFAAGTWNGDAYTTDDLDDMVRAFMETKGQMKPYLKLGHDDKQKMLQKDGLPAAGWIEQLYRKGKFLYAQFSKVPKKIYELIRAGAYRRVSSEIYINMDLGGRKFGKLLKAVALLGGDTPAVHELDDIIALYALGGEVKAFGNDHEVKTFEVTTNELKEDASMEELQKKLDEATAKVVEGEAKVKELTEKVQALVAENQKLAAQGAEQEKELATFKEAAEKSAQEKRVLEINTYLDKAIADKKILPAQREALFALFINAPTEKKFKLGETEQTSEEILKAFVDASSVSVNTEESTESGEPQDAEGDALVKKARDYSEKHKVSYREALLAVSPRTRKE